MNKEIDVLLQAVKEAGEVIIQLQNKGFSVATKSNKDLVTQADLDANEILTSSLAKYFPEDGFLSEECADNPSRLACKRVWVIDPIDGTIEYANGIPEYAISVALVEERRPVIAAIHNPATGELFHAIKGKGAWLNKKSICCDDNADETLLLLASRSEYQRGEWKSYELRHRVKQMGSIAYKLALVAAGRAHGTFSLGPKSEWDIAAGVLLISEAGGVVLDKNKSTFLFNQENVLVDGIVATSASHHQQIFDLIDAYRRM